MTSTISTLTTVPLTAESHCKKSNASTFRFLDLPFELRQFVYNHFIDYRRPAAIVSILRVNKQIKTEAMAAIFNKHSLIVVDL